MKQEVTIENRAHIHTHKETKRQRQTDRERLFWLIL